MLLALDPLISVGFVWSPQTSATVLDPYHSAKIKILKFLSRCGPTKCGTLSSRLKTSNLGKLTNS